MEVKVKLTLKQKILKRIREKIGDLGCYLNDNPGDKYAEDWYYFLCAIFF